VIAELFSKVHPSIVKSPEFEMAEPNLPLPLMKVMFINVTIESALMDLKI